MKNRPFRRYWLFCCAGVLAASCYPLWMGVRVIADMLIDGAVQKENYPKYIIPYTPICLAVLAGVLLMPLCLRRLGRFAFPCGAAAATGVFFALELLFEQKVVVTAAETAVRLEDWQMFMCYQPPGGWDDAAASYKTQTPVDILLGNYDPAFKLHFYVISVVLLAAVLNSLYGFGHMIQTGEKKRRRPLVLQSVCALVFLGLCILACFTAFWRDGSLQVSPLSAGLMAAFFILLGLTAGVFAGSFLLGKRDAAAIGISAAVSAGMTLLMYAGEMILLHGNLYRLGAGWLFAGLPGIVLAPIDLLIIAASGGTAALLLKTVQEKAG